MLVSALLLCYNLLIAFAAGLVFTKLLAKAASLHLPVLHPTILVLSGWVCLSIILQVFHLFYPISWGAHVCVWLFIFGGFAVFSTTIVKDAVTALHQLAGKQHIAVGVLLFVLVLINVVKRGADGDIGDYHLQAIRWAEEYATVPGIGNIRRQLGNNSNWFLLNAFSGLHFLGLRSVYTLNAGLVIMVGLYVTPHLTQHYWLRNFTLLLYFGIVATRKYTGAVTNDLIITSGIVVVFSWFVDLMDTKLTKPYSFMLLVVLVMGMITFKLSALPLAIFAIGVLWVVYQSGFLTHKLIMTLAVVALLLFIPWFVTNVMHSGYLLFPLHHANWFGVDWQMRPEVIAYEVYANLAYARAPTVDIETARYFSFSQWWPHWINSLDIFSCILLVGGAISLLVSTWQFMVNPRFRNYCIQHQFVWVGVTVLIALYLWFTHGPTPRFVFGYLLFMIAMGVSLIHHPWIQQRLHTWVFKGALSFLGILVLWQIATAFSTIREQPWLPPTYARTENRAFKVDGGVLWVPPMGKQCWDSELPCTNLPDSMLEFRGKSLQDGFRVKSHRE